MTGPEPGAEPDERTWLERYEATPPDRPVPRHVATAAVLVAAALCSLVAALTSGGAAVLAGPLAAVVVLAFFSSALLPLRLHDLLGSSARLGVGMIVLNYAFRVGAALLVLALVVGSGVPSRAAGLSVIACALVRVHATALLQARARAAGPPG